MAAHLATSPTPPPRLRRRHRRRRSVPCGPAVGLVVWAFYLRGARPAGGGEREAHPLVAARRRVSTDERRGAERRWWRAAPRPDRGTHRPCTDVGRWACPAERRQWAAVPARHNRRHHPPHGPSWGDCRAPRLAPVAGALELRRALTAGWGGGKAPPGRLHLREEHRPLPRRRRLAASLFSPRGRHPARAHHPPRRLYPTSVLHKCRLGAPALADETEDVKRPVFFHFSDCAHGDVAAGSRCDLCTLLTVCATVCIRFV